MKLDAAYIAGIFDGEGFFTMSWRKDFGYLKCEFGISMAEEFLIDLLVKQFPRACKYNKGKSKLGNKDIFMFRLNGSYAEDFVQLIEPYVIIKQKELEFWYKWKTMPKALPRQMTPEIMRAREALFNEYKAFRNK